MSRNLRNFVRFVDDPSGAAAVVFGVAGVAAVMAVGAAFTYAQAIETRVRAQRSIDAAVLAGVLLPEGAKPQERVDAATRAYLSNLKSGAQRSWAGTAAKFDVATSTPKFTVSGTTVSGDAVVRLKNAFPIVGGELIPVAVSAAARKRQSMPLCVLGLNTTAEGAFKQNGGSTFDATNCAAQFNTTSASGMTQQGHPTARAKAFGVSGQAQGAGFNPPPTTGTPPIADPFASLPFPPLGPCIDAASRFSKETVTLDPGTYCGGIDAKAGSRVTLNPGVYIVKDGNLTIQSGSTVRGSEVMIAFTGEAGNWPATLIMLGGSSMDVTSPVVGPYAGVQFFAAREKYSKMGWPAIGGSGGAAATLSYDGVMYFPTQDVWIYGGSVVRGKSPTVAIITEQLWVQDNASLTVTHENGRNVPVSAQSPSLQSGAVLVR